MTINYCIRKTILNEILFIVIICSFLNLELHAKKNLKQIAFLAIVEI